MLTQMPSKLGQMAQAFPRMAAGSEFGILGPDSEMLVKYIYCFSLLEFINSDRKKCFVISL